MESALRESGYVGEIELVQLLTSELVTNAVRHARPPFVLSVRLIERTAEVSIEDGDPDRQPTFRPPSTDIGDGGRGLVIVDSFADEWGCDVRPRLGKSVWFRLHPG